MSIQDIVKRAVLALGFEERTGLTAFDSSPKHNNGTLLKSNGVLPGWTAGKDGFGGALDFDGVGAYVDCGIGTKVNTLESNTVAGWVTIPDIDAAGDHIWFGSSQANRFYVGLKDGDYYIGYGDAFRATTPANELSDNVPAHWVFKGEDGTAKLFINGHLADSFSYTGVGDQVIGQIIGACRGPGAPYNPTAFADAIIDEVLMLPYALTPAEVRMLYESRSAFTATPNLRRGLVLDLDLQENAGLTAFDKSWYASNGTIVPGGNTRTNEPFTSVYDTPVQLERGDITPGTTVVTDNGATYTEGPGDDYTMDNEAGTITVLSTGAMAHDTEYYIDYDYTDPTWVAGGLDFDGVNDYVNLLNPDSLNITGSITIVALINPRPLHKGGVGPIFGSRSGDLGYWLTVSDGYYLRFSINTDWTPDTYVASDAKVSGMTFVVGKYDGSKLYVIIDDITKSSDTTQTSINIYDGNKVIGRERTDSAFYGYQGTIGKLRVYNRALTPTEIRAIREEWS